MLFSHCPSHLSLYLRSFPLLTAQRLADGITFFLQCLENNTEKKKDYSIIGLVLCRPAPLLHRCLLFLWLWVRFFSSPVPQYSITKMEVAEFPALTTRCHRLLLDTASFLKRKLCLDEMWGLYIYRWPPAWWRTIAQYICQSWIFLQGTCRSAGLCWHNNAPHFSEMPDIVI